MKIHIKRIIIGNDTMPVSFFATHYTHQEDYFLGKTLTIKGKLFIKEKPYQSHILTGSIVNDDYSLSFPGRIFNEVFTYINDVIKRNLNIESIPVAQGLLLGGSSRLNPELKDIFARAGILHILAVSGLHIGFVVTFLGILFLPLPVSPKIKFILIMTLLLLYIGLTGFRPNVLRASLMAFLLGVSLLIQRQVDTIHIINISALFLLVINPNVLFDIGAQLSFSAVYGIVYFMPLLYNYFLKNIKVRFFKPILLSIATSFSAQLFVAPFLVYYFNQLPTAAVFSNVLIVPLASFIVYFLFIMLFISLIFEPATTIISFFIERGILLIKGMAAFFARLPFSTISLTISPIFLIFFFFIFPHRTRKFALYSLCIIAIVFSIFPDNSIKMMNKTALITLPNSERILIYTGRDRSFYNLTIDGVDYLISQNKIVNFHKEFIPLPKALYTKEIKIDKLLIKIDRVISIYWQDKKFILPEDDLNNKIRIVILGKKGSYQFESEFDSIFDDIIIDLKSLWGQLLVNI